MYTVTAAYLRRDWLVWSSYRFAALFQIMTITVVVVGVAFAGDSMITRMSSFGESQDFASFILAGLAFTDALFSGLTGPSRAVRDGQTTGTLEPILLTPIRTWQFTIGSSVFQILLSFARAALMITAAVIFLGYWHDANVPAAVLVFVPGFMTMLGIGLLSSAFTIVVKQGDPIVAGYLAISGLLGGTIIPVASLPAWLQSLAELLPLTHALRGLRLALNGGGYDAVIGSVVILTAMAAVAMPAGLYASAVASRRARKEGSLVVY